MNGERRLLSDKQLGLEEARMADWFQGAEIGVVDVVQRARMTAISGCVNDEKQFLEKLAAVFTMLSGEGRFPTLEELPSTLEPAIDRRDYPL